MNIGSMRDWLAAGLTAAQFRAYVRTGELVQLRRGVYATATFASQAGKNDTLRHFVSVSAAIHAQYKDGTAVVSHQSAAILQGIDLLAKPGEGDTVWLTRPPGKYRGSRLGGVRLHSATVPEQHVTKVLGTRVTAPARTVLDLARSLPYTEGVIAADSALRTGATSKRELTDMLPFFAGWPGTGKAGRVVGFSDPLSESPLESAARVVFAEHSLPAPVLQAEITDDYGKFIGRVDFLWPEHRTIAEADGRAKFDQNQDTGWKQNIRDNRLRDQSYKVVHFTWQELFTTPEIVIARIQTTFAAPTPY